MRLFVAALGAAALSWPAAAGAQQPDWVRVGTYPDGGAIEVDRETTGTAGGLKRVRWRIVHPAPRQDGTAEQHHRELIDCAGPRSSVLATLRLDAGGQVLGEESDSENAARQRLGAVTPGSPGETVARAACAMSPKPRPRRRR